MSYRITKHTFLSGLSCAGLLALTSATATAASGTPHSLYNTGVTKLAENDLREAEIAFRSAVATNHEKVQPAALYNLGHIRFLQGKETLKGEGNRQQILDSSTAAATLAEEVIRRTGPIAEREDIQELINAYMEARATRKQLRLQRDENTRALDLIGSALHRWRRSVGDFRSAVELDAGNKDAAFNADVVERHIDELLNFQKRLQQEQEGVGQKRDKLSELMKKMRGKIPKEMQRGSDDEEGEEEDESEEEGPDPQAAKQQQQRIGSEREIDPDMLRVLKEKMQQRTMSVGQEGEQPREPKGRKGRDW